MISIVIPTMTFDLTEKCVNSIIQYTDMKDIEIIVVANGADTKIKDYIAGLDYNIILKWFDKPIGAPRAYNEGIKLTTGEYIILLNDDCEILPSEKNTWIDILKEPFSDPLIGCTGIIKGITYLGKNKIKLSWEDNEFGFIVFFCAMIPKKVFDKIGLLDENLRCAVDVDFCLRLRRAGYKIKQVPDDNEFLEKIDPDHFKVYFPIYHAAEATVQDYYGTDKWNNIMIDDIEKLEQKYPSEKNAPKVSIIIPTLKFDLFERCINSVLKHTYVDNIEIIVISNGENIETKKYCEYLVEYNVPIIYKNFDTPLGFTTACNEGIKIAKGEYIVLLNDDCEILPSLHNKWLYLLMKPFSNSLIGCVGPKKNVGDGIELGLSQEDSDFGFILFFCAMIPKRIFDEIGLLDENIKCGSDYDFSMRLKRRGYKITDTEQPFPIYHQAEATVHNFYGLKKWNEIILSDRKYLNEKYGIRPLNIAPKISIVIPTLNTELTKRCVSSIIEYTTMDNIEIIVVANGASQEIKSFCQENNIILKWFDEPIGAARAFNEGIKIVTGKYVILLNDDCILNEYPKDTWINYLITPFSDNTMGCTGPFRKYPVFNGQTSLDVDDNEFGFIVFFCAMIPKRIFDEIGLLDENLKCAVDVDFCLRLRRAGYKIQQVPDDNYYKLEYDEKNPTMRLKGNFPIKHLGETTVYNMYGDKWDEIVEEENKVIEERYGLKRNYDKSYLIDVTWPADQKNYELLMLQEFLKNTKLKRVLEIGTNKGGTALLWAKMVEPNDGHVYCCDLFFDWTSGLYAKNQHFRRLMYNDTPYENMITELQGDSHNPEFINFVKNTVGKVDMLFIDGDHSEDGVRQDFENFYDLVKIGGHIVFHDIVDSDFHRSAGCYVANFWNNIKDKYKSYEFIDQNEYADQYIYIPPHSMGIGVIKKTSESMPHLRSSYKNGGKNTRADILCFIPTKNRYFTTLPLTILSIICQNVKPDKILIYDDNIEKDRFDLRENETYRHLFTMLDIHNIKWEVLFGEEKGQHFGHQYANKGPYRLVWRVDDDETPLPDVLEKLLSHMKEDVGAVGGVIMTEPWFGEVSPYLEDIFHKGNVQWQIGDKVIEVDHLHSSFLYRTNIVNYCMELSNVCHREETIFSHELKRAGYKLLVDQSAITHHLRQEKTGIRTKNTPDMKKVYQGDDKIFMRKLEEWGYKLVTLDNGLGDHLAFLNILPKLKEKYKKVIIGCCYPEVFEDEKDIILINVDAAKASNDENIYQWMWDNNWNKNIVEAFKTYYGV